MKLLFGVTGDKEWQWKEKLNDLEKMEIKEAALFLERYEKNQRNKIYKALEEGSIKKFPLVHIRNDMGKEELKLLKKKYGAKYFTIHEDGFDIMEKWRGYYKDLYLEMNTDNFVAEEVKVKKIGGFCVDLSHFKVEMVKWSKEFEYIFKRRNKDIFACNHLNGYDPIRNKDMHIVKSLKDFDYLKALPEFLFGEAIAIEADNSIPEQLKFKNYLEKIL